MDNAPTKIPIKYFDHADIFFSNQAMELLKNIKTNEHAIELIDCKQLFYKSIYALSLVRLETLKTYIKTYLKTGFIRLSKSLPSVTILFDKEFDSSLRLCIDYQDLKNLKIKN